MSASDEPSSTSSSGSGKHGVKRKRQNSQALPAAAIPKIIETSALKEEDVTSDSSDSDSGSKAEEHSDEEEVEVLSHAAQRKLRKKAEKEAKEPARSSPDTTQDLQPKRQNSIWVGNLAFKTTEEALRAFFRRGVPGCEVTRVHLPTKTGSEVGSGRGMRGENRGFAYIDFGTKEAKAQAISLSEQNLDGRKLLIKDGGDFTGRPTAVTGNAESGAAVGALTSAVGKSRTAQRILAAQKQPPAQTLFLGNLGFQATEESIRGMIEGHMKTARQDRQKMGSNEDVGGANAESIENKEKKWLRKVRLGTFEDSGLCKGWAFVDFVSIEDATTVLLDPRNHHLDGRKLVVEYASAEAVRRGGGPGAKAHRDQERNEKVKGRRTGKSSYVESESKPGAIEGPEDEDGPPAKKWKGADERQRVDRTGKKRPRPGAALALAQREKVAIVPSSGKKIVF